VNAIISVIHATLGRPKKAVETMRRWFDEAEDGKRVEYLFVLNIGDPTHGELMDELEKNEIPSHGPITVIGADVEYSAPAWNVGAIASHGKLIIQAQDDVEPPENWDEKLDLLVRLHGGYDEPLVIAVGDGYRKGHAALLMCTAICNRARINQEGFFLYPGYQSVFSDDDFSYRAYRDERDGCVKVIRAPRLVFLHRHHYHAKEVPWDSTYAHENDPAAYALGQRLFNERNPRALTDGLKRW